MKTTIRKLISILLAALLLLAALPASAAADGEQTYSLRYFLNGQHYMSALYEEGESVRLIEMTEIGKTYSRWQDESGAVCTLTEMPARDVNVYATWSWIPYSVTYYVDGVLQEELTVSTHFGATIGSDEAAAVRLPVIEKTGCRFSGWTLDGGGAVPNTVPGSLVLVGSLTPVQYALRYVLDGEPLTDKTTLYHYGDTIEYLNEYNNRLGFDFSGWKTDAGETPLTMPASDLTVAGTRTYHSYTLSYYLNGELVKTQSYRYNEPIQYISTYNSITGMSFSGWQTEDSTRPDTMPNGDLSVYATSTAQKYTVVYNLNGEYLHTQTYEYNQLIDYITSYDNLPGSTFSGWKQSDGTLARELFTNMPAQNLVLFGTLTSMPTAKFTGGTYSNAVQGTVLQVHISVAAPYLQRVDISSLAYDTDCMVLQFAEWLVDDTQTAAFSLETGSGSVTFAENRDISNRPLLRLTFLINDNAAVGAQSVTFNAAAYTYTEGLLKTVPTTTAPAEIALVCAVHSFTNGEVQANFNGTHSVLCANGCGVTATMQCAGGTATCLRRPACTLCGQEYGFKLPHSYIASPRDNGDGTHSYKCINGCDTYSTEVVECSYGVAVSNGNNTHTRLCSLCSHAVSADCAGGTATCLAAAVCEGCHSAYGECLPHAYTGTLRREENGMHSFLCVNGCESYGGAVACEYTAAPVPLHNGTHKIACSCGNEAVVRCSGGVVSCEARPVCSACGQSYGYQPAHSYTGEQVQKNADGTHSRRCVNGCGRFGDPQPCSYGEPITNADGTHSRFCTVCGNESRESCSGGTATCLQARLCAVCGAAYGEKLLHRYEGAYVQQGCPEGVWLHARLCVNGCGEAGSAEGCSFGAWEYPGDGTHVRTCTVCGQQELVACSGGTASCTQRAVCPTCNHEYGETLPHTFSEEETGILSNSDGTHMRLCTVCGQTVPQSCTGGTATCTLQAVCTLCGGSYGATAPHDYKYIAGGNGTHRRECRVCLESGEFACSGGSATCAAAASCEYCGSAYGSVAPHAFSGTARDNADGTHSLACLFGCGTYGEALACSYATPTPNGDGTHSSLCTVCGAKTIAACTGGTATCQQKASCESCGGFYGDGGTHRYETIGNDTEHWAQCSVCGIKTAAEPHSFTEPYVVRAATVKQTGEQYILCTVCGVTVRTVLPRPVPMGDLNMDGSVGSDDARLALRSSVGLESLRDAQQKLADADANGRVDAADARLLLRASVQLEDSASWGTLPVDDAGELL